MPQNQPRISHNPLIPNASTRLYKDKLFRVKYFRPALFIGLLVVLAVSYSSRNLHSSAQEGRAPREIPANTSLAEAVSQGLELHPKVEKDSAPDVTSAAEPEGGSCSWTAGTVTTAPVLDEATAVVGNNLYTFAGVANGAIVANSFKFDGTTWTPIAPLPTALEFPTAVTDGTVIYILGGADSTGLARNLLYKYDPVANSYTPLAAFTTGTWNTAAVFLNGKIYKFGGTTGPSASAASTNAMEIYDVVGNSWTPGANYPTAASFIGAFTKGGFIYGAGGIASVGSVVTAKTYRYDTVANSWDDAAIADLPATRWGAASSGTGYGSNNGWVLAGGYVAGAATANISNTVIRWDSVGNTWASLPNMTGERSRMTGGILNSSFYVVGGRSVASPSFVGTNTNQKFTCVSNVVIVNPGTVTITAEGCGTPNNAPDPGETLTVALPITNTGDIPSTNLTATLLATGGVTNPGSPQNYGAVPPAGGTVTKNFTFVVDPNTACGGSITLTWTIADGATTYPNATKTYTTGVFAVSLSENFDSLIPPALPAGWTTAVTGTGVAPTTSTTNSSSAPNNAFLPEQTTTGTNEMVTSGIPINSAAAQVTFKNLFNLENTFDGMVLEISNPAVNGGAFQDIVTAGGSFVSGGYRAGIVQSGTCEDPLNGRQAWTGLSGGTTAAPTYIDTVVNLPANANGQTIKLKFLVGSDCSIAGTTTPGARIDDLKILGDRVCNNCGGPIGKARSDFDGDGKSDVSVFRPSDGIWYLLRSTAGFTGIVFGSAGDKIVPGDYDGDGKTDEAVFRGGTTWYILRSSNNTVIASVWGAPGDIPVAGDYDADGKTDIAVYRPSSNDYFVRYSSGIPDKFFHWGLAGDIPVVGDFDGDSKTDYTVFRPNTATWHTVSGGFPATYKATIFGQAGDKLVASDFDGDHKTDIAVFRAGVWYIINSSTNTVVVQSWGLGTDKVVPADYDGDGKDDIAVFRDGFWYIFGSGTNAVPEVIRTVQLGLATDNPTQTGYVPEQ